MPPSRPARPRVVSSEPPEVVDPRWILKAAGAVVAVGVFCSYLTLCLFFSYGQWQFVLHPSRQVPRSPAALQLPFRPVRFGPDVSGQPQLSGWWIPSESPSDPTVLLLHSETGSMSDALPAAKALHDVRLNVLVFDYRGFGQSAGRHPTEKLMRADAEDALRYLAETHKAAGSTLLVYGDGLGASLAVGLCAGHPEIQALILSSADGDTLARVEADQRSRIVPLQLLFHERFPLADPLSRLHTPKLLISYTHGNPPLIAERAADPKMTAELAPDAPEATLLAVLRRFLDSYVPRPASTLK